MWVGDFFGMMTNYMEVFLAVEFRPRDPDSRALRGGPMYYISKGISGPLGKILAVLFCIFCALASFSSGRMTQTNAIAQSLWESFSLSPTFCAVILTLLSGWVFSGGCDGAVKTGSSLGPPMSMFYLLGCGVILFFYRQHTP